jgi:archaeal type IV pilus assembly protein PilA
MKKLLKSKKALSPVVAAIILIAVTVAVSIAVAAWMGSLTIGFMETSELTVTQMTFDTSATNATTVYLTNSGTSAVTVSMVKLNGNTITTAKLAGDPADYTLDAGETGTITITYNLTGQGIFAGNKYSVNMFANDGTLIGSFTDTA